MCVEGPSAKWGGSIFMVSLLPSLILMVLTLRVSMLRQLCMRPAAWYFWSAVVVSRVIQVWRELGNGPQSTAGAILIGTTNAVMFGLLPMVDALAPKVSGGIGRFVCPPVALCMLINYISGKLAEQPWPRNGNVWEWLVKDADGHTHEARHIYVYMYIYSACIRVILPDAHAVKHAPRSAQQ